MHFHGGVHHLHIATVTPRAVRGNHFHAGRREVLVALADDSRPFSWDAGPDRPVRQRRSPSVKALTIEIQPSSSHAVARKRLWSSLGPSPA
jgi:hypothetical protein